MMARYLVKSGEMERIVVAYTTTAALEVAIREEIREDSPDVLGLIASVIEVKDDAEIEYISTKNACRSIGCWEDSESP